MLFSVIFQSKSESFHLFVVVFLCIFSWLRVTYNSQATNRSGWGPLRESSLLPMRYLGVIYDTQPRGYALFYSHPDLG
jgi:hypothetical protein